MIFSRTIFNIILNNFSFPASLIFHTIFLMYVMNFINYKSNFPIQNNKIIELQLLGQSKNKTNILQEGTLLLPKKSNNSGINSKDLKISNGIKKKSIASKLRNNNFQENQIKAEKKNIVDKENNDKNKKDLNKVATPSKEKKLKSAANQLSDSTQEESYYIKRLEEYKVYLKNKIQNLASSNYPNISVRKREEGNVEIIFSLDNEGLIKEVIVGKNSNASKRLIDSLTNVLKNKIVKFEKNEILKKVNTFSINIVYKLK